VLLLPNIDFLVDPLDAVERVREAYLLPSKCLPRQALTVGETWFAPMVGYLEGAGIAAKLVGIYPRGAPRVRAVVLLFDPETGDPLALMNGTQLTAWRTAAASAVAARAMGAEPEEVGIVGAGVQGEYHLRVFRALYPSARFRVYSRTEARARSLAERHGAEATGVDGVLKSDLIIAATNSSAPVIAGSRLKRGAVVISVGAPRPVRELDDDAKRRAGCMLVDSPHAAEESDDVGGRWVYVGDFLRGARCEFGEIRIYKSVGNPLFDAALARYVLERARRLGVGVEVLWDFTPREA
jgi:alanine dehydrogenase